ncbi:hypothetical protein P280DRAFT_172592 [Massarina eburnea CBS 473.64]|uniref:Uncharacterized protein n=1 Tax=Massarina eburnea CBS 473.64 TaxID=1395130 RepID=A0A6A6SCN7_9PLEO|nr:hypothetical protein P280DRAFT_172592 [Massarina eburnea CBS 473.64]
MSCDMGKRNMFPAGERRKETGCAPSCAASGKASAEDGISSTPRCTPLGARRLPSKLANCAPSFSSIAPSFACVVPSTLALCCLLFIIPALIPPHSLQPTAPPCPRSPHQYSGVPRTIVVSPTRRHCCVTQKTRRRHREGPSIGDGETASSVDSCTSLLAPFHGVPPCRPR